MSTHPQPELRKQILVDAMRSGKYTQCCSVLYHPNDKGGISYCVIGLAYHLIGGEYTNTIRDLNVVAP